MVAYVLNRGMSLEIHDMSRVIQARTSEMSEDFGRLNLSFSMAKLGIHPCQLMRTRAELDAN